MQLTPDVPAHRRARCVCPGSFDPVTCGHVDLVRRAATLFDEVIVAVLTNPAKTPAFDLDERRELLRLALDGVPGVRVDAFGGRLLVDYCRQVGATAVVKGLRGAADLDHETPMALMNRHLAGVETVFLITDPARAHLSSTLVREVARYGGDLDGLVPGAVRDRVAARLAPSGFGRPRAAE